MSLLSAIRKILKKPQDSPFITLSQCEIIELLSGRRIMKTCTKTSKAYYVRLSPDSLISGANIKSKDLIIERVCQNEKP